MISHQARANCSVNYSPNLASEVLAPSQLSWRGRIESYYVVVSGVGHALMFMEAFSGPASRRDGYPVEPGRFDGPV